MPLLGARNVQAQRTSRNKHSNRHHRATTRNIRRSLLEIDGVLHALKLLLRLLCWHLAALTMLRDANVCSFPDVCASLATQSRAETRRAIVCAR
eukprot:15409-Heterococcus_DN1.PRE.3